MEHQLESTTDFSRPKLLADHVYQQLKAMIVNNQIRPGEALGEERLAAQWGISRTPLRTALARLERDGLILMIPHRGCIATEIHPTDVRDLFQAREALEVAIIQWATPVIPQESLDELGQLFAAIDRDLAAGRYDTYIPSDARFHALLLEHSTNAVLDRMIGQLYEQITRIRNYSHSQPGEHMREAHGEHRHILAALQARDPEAAGMAMRDHLRNVTRRAIALLPGAEDGLADRRSANER